MKLIYIPIAITWIVLLAMALNHWISYDETPSTVLIVFLAALSLVPIADRLKIGNLIDFSKKINGLSTDLNATKQDLGHLSNQFAAISSHLQNIATQSQLQVIANIPSDPETAKAFAASLLQQRGLHPDSTELQKVITDGIMDVVRSQSSSLPLEANKLPPESEKVLVEGVQEVVRNKLNTIYFVAIVDQLLAAYTVALQSYYTFSYSLVEGKSAIDAKVVPVSLAPLINSMRELCSRENSPVAIIVDKIVPYFDDIEYLIQLRNSVSNGEEKPPSPDSIHHILSKAHMATGILEGAVATLLDILGLNMLSLKDSLVIPNVKQSSDEPSD